MNNARVWWGIGIVLVLAALVVCLVPIQMSGPPEVGDKVSHLIGHGALAIYFAGLVPRARWWKIFLFLLFFGAAVELAQANMDLGRHGDLRDIVANCLGAALGLLLAWIGLSRWPAVAARLLGGRRASP